MNINFPVEWMPFYQRPAYFITYFGEIYFGSIWECPGYDDRVFIIQNDKIRDVIGLKTGERTLEKYQQLGREILDSDLIRRVEENHFGNEINFNGLSYSNNQQFRKMFVFGAGASAHCVFGKAPLSKLKNSPLCPPMGYELFDEKYQDIIRNYPGADLSIPLVKSKNNDIEQTMQEEWENVKSRYVPNIAMRHINIQFFLQSLVQKSTKEVIENHSRENLYNLLLDKLEKCIGKNPTDRVSIVSYNYDTIIDHFISKRFRIPFDRMDDYINWNKNKILLFKPHGSCNWGWRFRKDRINGNTQDTIAQALYDSNIEPHQIYFELLGDLDDMIAQNTWGFHHSNDKYYRGKFTINKNLIERIPESTNEVYFPSLLIPYRDKDEELMPYDHINAMRHCLDEVEDLYLIGWKCSEALFNKQLEKANKLKRIVIVNPDPESVIKNLPESIDRRKIKVEIVPFFEDFVLNHLDRFLA